MHGPQLIREVRELSPQTAALLMTGGFVKSADTIPKSVAVVKKPFTTAELVFAVQSVLAQSAALSEELRERCEISVKLGQEGGRLRSEAEAAVRKSILLRERRKRKRAPDV
jgi:hypothetical protein